MSKNINVLQVSRVYYPVPGGIQRVVRDIAEGLQPETNMSVLTCREKGKKCIENIGGVPVTYCGSFGLLCSLPVSPSFLWNFFKMSRTSDIVHIHMPFPLADLACLLSGYKGKVVLWWHSDVVRQKKMMGLYRPLMNWMLRRADMIMVATEGHIAGSSYLGDYRDKCLVIPFGVERELLQCADEYLKQRKVLKNEETQVSGQLRFLFIGRLVYYKGCDVLLRAFAKVGRGTLVMIGDGPLAGELKKSAADLNIAEKVVFLGKMEGEALYKELSRCDVLVLPSVAKSEAFGIVQIEAMAYGKPVINTRLPSGVPFVSLDHQTGLTVTPGRIDELADAMTWMTDHPEERIRYGSLAAQRVREHYNLKDMLEAVLRAYRDLCGYTEGDKREDRI